MSRFNGRVPFIVVLAILSAAQLLAQGGATGAITGTVQDPSGAVVPDADVKIVNQDTGIVARTLKTSPNGSFTASLLPAGSYVLTVNSPSFQEARFSGVIVRVTETTRMTAKLVPVKVLEKVEVHALVSGVETTTATTGQAIEANTIRELPLATQNFEQLLALSSGAQSELNASAQLGRGNVRVIVNGQREDNNNYLIEGISATDYNVSQATNVPLPNPDVIQQFKVQTSLYDASQGRNGGGNVNAVLKSGTKAFHGDAYEFFRNDVLNANEYFLNRAGQSRPSVKQNIFGGSFGGPIGGNAKGGFFFVNYQGTRQRSGLSPGTFISAHVPILPADRSPANLAAVFQVPIIDQIIANPQGTGLLQQKGNQFPNADGYLIPSGVPGPNCAPNCAPGIDPSTGAVNTGQYIVSKPGRYTEDQFTTNWDRDFRGGRDKVSARFFFSNSESFLPFGAGGLQASLGGTLASSISATDLNFPYDLPLNTRFFSASDTHLFSPQLVNDLRFGYVRINNSLINVPPITAVDLGIDRPTNNVTKSIYKFTLASFQIGPTPPADQFQTQNNYNFVETLSWGRGAHTWRFGGEYTRVNLDKLFPQTFNGQLFFFTSSGLTDFQKFLEGAPDASFGGGGVYNHKYRTNNFGFFVQDDWKARSNLTLNLGFRTEVLGAFYDKLCHIGNFDPQVANSGQYPFFYGSCVKKFNIAGLVGRGNDTTYENNYATGLEPRVGFAWDMFGDQKTSLRGGFGIYFVREDVGTVDQLSFQAPFLPIAGLNGLPGCMSTFFSPDAPAVCDQLGPGTGNLNALPPGGQLDTSFIPCSGVFTGFSGSTAASPNFGCAAGSPGSVPAQFLFVLTVPRHFLAPNIQQWNLTLQRELGKQWVLEVGYVGTHGIHLRNTRTNIQSRLATANDPIFLTATDGTTYKITESTAANAAARSNLSGVNGGYGFQIFASDAYSHYHSLQTTVSRRWGNGYFQAAYTFSKATDATSSGNTALNTAFNDERNIQNSYGLSDFDRKHRFTISYRYELPFFSKAQGVKHVALADWSISGITIFQSGAPFSVVDSAAGSAYLLPSLAPSALGAQLAPGGSASAGLTSGDIHKRIDGYLNAANFTTAPPADPAGCALDPAAACTTAFGNLGRNIYRGPFQQNWDVSVIKNFRIRERQELRFTTDFFNVWNHANFGNPSQTATDVEFPSSFGKITSTVGTPRLIQFSLRWAF